MSKIKSKVRKILGKGDTNAHKDKEVSTKIEQGLKKQKKEQRSTVEILFLGAGGSGKTTVVKHMLHMYKDDADEKSSAMDPEVLGDIHRNVIFDIYDLCQANLSLRPLYVECQIDDMEVLAIVDALGKQGTHIDQVLRLDFARQIEKIWADPAVKSTFDVRRLSHVIDNTPYFFDKVVELADPNYQPTFDDYIRVRDCTTGVLNHKFQVTMQGKPWTFSLTDVGGQRSERRKWLKVFTGVDVVIFVMSLSGYDQVIFEDDQMPCWNEALSVFSDIVNNKVFENTDFTIFLNKTDIFEEKLKTTPFTVYEPEFDREHAQDVELVTKYIVDKLTHIFNENRSSRTMFCHRTCATDTEQMQTVINNVQTGMVKKMMQHAALI